MRALRQINWLDRLAFWWLTRRHPALSHYVVAGLEQETANIRARLTGGNG